MKVSFVIVIIALLTSSSYAQNTEEWHISYYLQSYDFAKSKGKVPLENVQYSSELIEELGDSSVLLNTYVYRKSILVRRLSVDERGNEKLDGEQLSFENDGFIYHSAIYEDGILEKEFGYLYYKTGMPMIKYQLRAGCIWSIEEYYFSDGQRYFDYGSFRNGEGRLNVIYQDRKGNTIVPYEYYLKNGRQRRRAIRNGE